MPVLRFSSAKFRRTPGRLLGAMPGVPGNGEASAEPRADAGQQPSLPRQRGLFALPMGIVAAILGVLAAHQIVALVPGNVAVDSRIGPQHERAPYSLSAWRNISAYALPTRPAESALPELDDQAAQPNEGPDGAVATSSAPATEVVPAPQVPAQLLEVALDAVGSIPRAQAAESTGNAAEAPASYRPAEPDTLSVLPSATVDAAEPAPPASIPANATPSQTSSMPGVVAQDEAPPLPVRKPHWLIKKPTAPSDSIEARPARTARSRQAPSSDDEPARASAPKAQPAGASFISGLERVSP